MADWRGERQQQLEFLYRRQGGKCHICGEPVAREDAVRFRLGSSYGSKGRVRRRVMAHHKCAQERSDQITASQPIEDLWHRSRSEPSEWSVTADPSTE